MKNIEKLIKQHVKPETEKKLNALYDILSQKGSVEDRKALADAYLDDFAQCHYDYMCGKFNKPEWIWELKEDLERVKDLDPEFVNMNYFEAHVYEMLSSVSSNRDDRVRYRELCIELLRNQENIDPEDVTLLTDLADNILELCIETNTFHPGKISEIKEYLLQAIHLSQQPGQRHTFYGFNGTAISHFLNTAYKFLQFPLENKSEIHEEFISVFETHIEPYALENPEVYFHWSDTLLRLIDNSDHPKSELYNADGKLIDLVLQKARTILEHLSDPTVLNDNEPLLAATGHLFMKMAARNPRADYFKIAFDYYYRSFTLKSDTWTTPLYCSKSLHELALIHLHNNEQEKARDCFDRALRIFEIAQQQHSDFQLSLNHADFLFEFSRIFEGFRNAETLDRIKNLYEESREMSKDFYTQPYYGLARCYLLMGDKAQCLNTMKTCLDIFSNEYHIHDFGKVFEMKDFEPVYEEITEMIEQKRATTARTTPPPA